MRRYSHLNIIAMKVLQPAFNDIASEIVCFSLLHTALLYIFCRSMSMNECDKHSKVNLKNFSVTHYYLECRQEVF